MYATYTSSLPKSNSIAAKFVKKSTLNTFLLWLDQKNLEEEISKLRKDLKPKVSKLHELEGWLPVLYVSIFFSVNAFKEKHGEAGWVVREDTRVWWPQDTHLKTKHLSLCLKN